MLSTRAAPEISSTPTSSRRPKGSPAHRAAVMPPTVISVMNRIPTSAGSICFGPHAEASAQGTTTRSPTGTSQGRGSAKA
ncbi:MAG TPA: hypothetical protein VHK03_13540 [Aestuariivirgaceae bacterium]|nr:hypothetical protein [Aestuariivirgaceae bacterium]